ncbi:MAG: glycosyltransferase [Thaumarchaeota archaeon]|nr:glycosyltransferase [Nitrososphaerota archaeon]
MSVTRLVQVKVPIPTHGAYRILADYPPEGYGYELEGHRALEVSPNPFFKAASRILFSHRGTRDALLLARERLAAPVRAEARYDLIFSLMPFSGYTSTPTVLYSEYASANATALGVFRSMLLKSGLKRILVFSPAAAKTYLSVLSEGEFERLVDVLRIGVPAGEEIQRVAKGHVTFLFIASGHTWEGSGELSFLMRGGPAVLGAFRMLYKQYGERVKLIVRSPIPTFVKELYADVLKIPSVSVYEELVPRDELLRLFQESDVLLHPGYQASAMTIPEAFGYSMPVVTTDIYDSADFVSDGFTGLVVHRDAPKVFKTINHIPSWDAKYLIANPSDTAFESDLAASISRLVEDEALRLRLSKNARAAVESGDFSLSSMKEKLAQVFAEAMS